MDTQWKPSEIIIDRRVDDDPVTRSIIEKCPSVPVRYVDDAKPTTVVAASDILSNAGSTMLEKIIAGKLEIRCRLGSSGGGNELGGGDAGSFSCEKQDSFLWKGNDTIF